MRWNLLNFHCSRKHIIVKGMWTHNFGCQTSNLYIIEMPRSLPFNRHSNFSSCVRLCTSLVDNLCKHISKLVKIDLASLLCSCYSSRFPHYELCPGTLNTLIFLLVWNHTQLFDMLSLIRHSISINICQCMHPIWMETRRTQIVQTRQYLVQGPSNSLAKATHWYLCTTHLHHNPKAPPPLPKKVKQLAKLKILSSNKQFTQYICQNS